MAILRLDPIPASNHSTSPTLVPRDSSVRRTARIVGILFLAGYLAYGVGSLIATGIVRSGDRSGSTPGDQPGAGGSVARGSSHRAAGSSRAPSTSDAKRRVRGLDD